MELVNLLMVQVDFKKDIGNQTSLVDKIVGSMTLRVAICTQVQWKMENVTEKGSCMMPKEMKFTWVILNRTKDKVKELFTLEMAKSLKENSAITSWKVHLNNLHKSLHKN